MCASVWSCCPFTSCWPLGGALRRSSCGRRPCSSMPRDWTAHKPPTTKDGGTDLVIINTIMLIIMPLWFLFCRVQRLTFVFISVPLSLSLCFSSWTFVVLSPCANHHLLRRLVGWPSMQSSQASSSFTIYDGDGGAWVASLRGDEVWPMW